MKPLKLQTLMMLVLAGFGCSGSPGEEDSRAPDMDMSADSDMKKALDMPQSLDADADSSTNEGRCGSEDDRLMAPFRLEELKGCRIYLGSLSMFDHPSDDVFEVLSNLVVIEGDLQVVRYQNLRDVNGLQNLTRVGGNISLRFLFSLTKINLEDLKVVDGDLWASSLGSLEDLQGLEKLESVGGLYISLNPKLKSLQGLKNLKEVRGNLRIDLNESLPKKEIEDLLARVNVSGTIEID